MITCPIRYLAWARQHYGSVAFDLATSGLPSVSLQQVETIAPGARTQRPDDYTQLAAFPSAVARWHKVARNRVVACLGTSSGLWTACSVLTDPGDEVLVEDPGYEPLWAVPAGLGRTVRRFPRNALFAPAIVPDELGVSPRTRLVVISNPHNPSGTLLDDGALVRVAEALAAHGVTLLVDEVYREFVVPGTTSANLHANVRAVSSLTKRFGLGWARAGWMIIEPDEVDAATEALTHAVGALPPWGFGIALHVIEHAEEMGRLASRGQQNQRELLTSFARRHCARLDFTPSSGQVPFAFFVDRRGGDLRPIIERGIVQEGVIVAPGSFFGVPAGFRLSVTADPERFAEGLRRLERVLEL